MRRARRPVQHRRIDDLSDPGLVAREYATVERLACRRLDRTGWLGDVGQPLEALLGAVAEARPQRVLDAGCGDGWWASLVAAPEVVCVDRSEAAVAAVAARGLTAVRADLAALPFDDGEFDVVMCNWVLYHLPDLDRAIAELARVLRPGGRLVGGYNREGHLEALWSRVARRPRLVSFDGESGGEILAPSFEAVERRDTGGSVLWRSRTDLQAFLDAHVELLGPLDAPPGPYPFVGERRNCVFVADRPRARAA